MNSVVSRKAFTPCSAARMSPATSVFRNCASSIRPCCTVTAAATGKGHWRRSICLRRPSTILASPAYSISTGRAYRLIQRTVRLPIGKVSLSQRRNSVTPPVALVWPPSLRPHRTAMVQTAKDAVWRVVAGVGVQPHNHPNHQIVACSRPLTALHLCNCNGKSTPPIHVSMSTRQTARRRTAPVPGFNRECPVSHTGS